MSLTGVWTNSYGSVMSLTQSSSGVINGNYQSSTGSTGKYYVVGAANPSGPTPQMGQSVSLSIYWRSYAGGSGDPSWHWVSGLSGQLSVATSTPTIYLLHAMVATDNFPGVADAGTYLDKLIYTPKAADADPVKELDGGADSDAAGPIGGVWQNREDPSTYLSLNAPTSLGYITGEIIAGPAKFPIWGFTDVYAQSGGIARQGLSITSMLGAPGTQSLAGSLEFSTGVLTLSVFSSQGTPGDVLYTQTKLTQATFVKVAAK